MQKKQFQISDRSDNVLNWLAHISLIAGVVAPQYAMAQSFGGGFSGIGDFLGEIANLLIFEWGYYLGIITLAIQAIRWKTGRIDLFALGAWAAGIFIVFWAPQIVRGIRNSAGSQPI